MAFPSLTLLIDLSRIRSRQALLAHKLYAWLKLTEFVKRLGRIGVAWVDQAAKGWFNVGIDGRPKALRGRQANATRNQPNRLIY